MLLTLVICTYNRSELLLRTIESINDAKKPTNVNIQILVITNACTDNTTQLLKQYQTKQCGNGTALPLQFEPEPLAGKSHALNRAISIINDGYLCFVDDDHRIDSNYLCAIANVISHNPETTMFCGQIIPDWTGSEPHWIHDQGKYRIYPLPIPHFELGEDAFLVDKNNKIPGGGNLIIHHGVFKRIGGFSTVLGPVGRGLQGSEDSDFVLRTLNAGEKIIYHPSIIQYHYVDLERLKIGYLLAKSYQRTRSLTLVQYPLSTPVPLYLWRKLINYLIGIICSYKLQKIRFYMMRLAAALGECAGLRDTS